MTLVGYDDGSTATATGAYAVRVVAYVRMSTGRQECSPAQQRAALAAHAKKQGYAIAREYADLGVSGDKTAKRKAFQAMIADGAAGKFDRILAFDRSRFGRFDGIEYGRWVQPLREAGVQLETLEGGVEDWDDLGGRLQGMIASEGKHAYLVDVARATTRGLTAKAVEGRGHPGGVTPYGYIRRTELVGKGGQHRHSTLEIDPAKADIVRRIFKHYNSSAGSLNAVSRMLNDEKVPTAGGGEIWRKNAVQRILQNEVYAGVMVYGRRQKGTYYAREGTEIVRRRRGAKTAYVDPIRHEGAVPAIIDRKTFDTTQRLMGERAGTSRAPGKIRPLSGVAVCARCGSKLHADGEKFMRCPSSAPGSGSSRSCSSSRIEAKPLLATVLTEVAKSIKAPGTRRAIEAAVRRMVAPRRPSTGTGSLAALEARHRAAAAEIAAGVERLPLIPQELVGDLTAVLSRKAAERDRLADEIKAARRRGSRTADSDAVRAAMARLDRLVGKASAERDPRALNQLLRTLGVTVAVTPGKATSGKSRATIKISGGPTRTSPYAVPVTIRDFSLFSIEVAYGKAG